MKVLLEYDKASGNVTDANGNFLVSWPNLKPFEIETKSESISVEDLIKLKNAGFTTDEIVELNRKALI